MQSEVKARVSYLVQKNYVVLVGQNGGVAGVRNPLKKQFHGALRIFTLEPCQPKEYVQMGGKLSCLNKDIMKLYFLQPNFLLFLPSCSLFF